MFKIDWINEFFFLFFNVSVAHACYYNANQRPFGKNITMYLRNTNSGRKGLMIRASCYLCNHLCVYVNKCILTMIRVRSFRDLVERPTWLPILKSWKGKWQSVKLWAFRDLIALRQLLQNWNPDNRLHVVSFQIIAYFNSIQIFRQLQQRLVSICHHKHTYVGLL